MSSRRIPYALLSTISALFGLLSLATAIAAQQAPPAENPPQSKDQTTVQVLDAGGGSKQELVRNAAGQEIENRTYYPQGTLSSRVNNIYTPGHLAPDQITTSFYPDGKTIRTSSKVTYDESANFLFEETAQFDQSGKRTSGHKLLHDPASGMYRCWKWSGPEQKYSRVVCPSGEESGEKPPPAKPVTQEEAIKLLTAARTAAANPHKAEPLVPKNMLAPPVDATGPYLAIVLPANLASGKQVSGSIQENPYLFRLRPELIVQDLKIPVPAGSDSVDLSGWRVEIAGAPAQRADRPFKFTVPNNASQLEVKLYPEGDAAKAITQSITVPKNASKPTKATAGYLAQALCVAGDVCPIAGVFTGDATTALAAFDDKPVPIAAETSDMVFVRVPEDLMYGERRLLFNEGTELLAFSVAIAQVNVVVDGRQLDDFRQQVTQGQQKLVFAGVIGVQTLPEEEWRAGSFPSSNLEWARRFSPNFQIPHETHADREERETMERLEQQEKGVKPAGKQKEEKLGYIVYVVKNTTPDVVTWRGAKDGVVVMPLNPESFSQGDYRYKFVAEASKTGTYAMDAAVIPFIAPTQGQKFTVSEAGAGSN